MGLIHSRASKHRAKAEAELLKEQTRQLRDERKAEKAEAAEDLPAWRQPTLGAALGKLARQRNEGQHK